ncbi:MAG: hypothetical protein ABSC48_19885 [Terracidiphilus sp.]|jgi:hypothetical protein
MRIVSWTILAALSLAPIASAQSGLHRLGDNTASEPAPDPASITTAASPAIAAVVSAVMPGAAGMTAVKGLPFSATQTTVHEQTLSDGTVIKSTVEVSLWRDSEGRMRAESTVKPKSGDGPQTHVVAVWNPAERKEMSWVTGSQSATIATVLHLPELQLNGMMSALASPPPPAPGTLSRSLETSSLPTLAGQSAANTHTETLGPEMISGLEVTGTRTTQVVPAGSIDNDRDFTVTSETWTSAELKITVRQTISDPRTGTVTAELTNIDRSEPDAALFKPPAGTRLMDVPDLVGSGGKR